MREIHIHQYLADPPLPPTDDEYRASARNRPGEWVYYVDPGLPAEAPKVVANITGGREVGPDGEFTGRYWVNPEFMPQPATSGVRFSTSFELVLWRLLKGFITFGDFIMGFAEAKLLTHDATDVALILQPDTSSSNDRQVALYTSSQFGPDDHEQWHHVNGREVIKNLGEFENIRLEINPGHQLSIEFTAAELRRLFGDQQDYLARAGADPTAKKTRVRSEPRHAERPNKSKSSEKSTSPRSTWLENADPEARKAVEKVEAWLTSSGNPVGEFRVDYENIRRLPEGWLIPYGNKRWSDDGDEGTTTHPPLAVIVRVPQGDLRYPSTLADGISTVVENTHGDTWMERVDPEFAESEVGGLGVPDNAIIGWIQMHADHSYGKMRWNPESGPGPIRRGFPPAENQLEQLLNFHYLGWLTREKFLIGLVRSEVIAPLHWESDSIASGWTEDPRRLLVYSSTRRLVPSGLSRWHKWQAIPVYDFIKEFPNTGLVINKSQFPTVEVNPDELVSTAAQWPRYVHADKKIVIDWAVGPELANKARHIQNRFELPAPPPLPETEAEQARYNGFELTAEECEKHLLGRAWEIKNGIKFVWSLDSKNDDISHEEWPKDLRANGLSATYDSRGRVRPRTSTFGKYFRMEARDSRFGWHRVVGAYIGFALGDALGSAVDGLSWSEISERFGGAGVHDLPQVFDRPGQISALTQQLLFLTEGTIRGEKFYDSEGTDPALPKAIRNALFRWAYTQGVPWSKLGGRLDPSSTEPDGWLVKVPELHHRRAPELGALDAIRALACGSDEQADAITATAFPALVAALVSAPAGKFRDTAGNILGVCHLDPLDVLATRTLSALLMRLMQPTPYVDSVFIWCRRMYQEKLSSPDTPEGESLKELLLRGLDGGVKPMYDPHTLEEIFNLKKMHSIGNGQDAASILVRALYSVTQREGYPDRALRAAVNHSGRSALTGAITGALLGARLGVPGLPRQWVEQLELRDLIENVASDLYWHFCEQSPLRSEKYADEWRRRYPREVQDQQG